MIKIKCFGIAKEIINNQNLILEDKSMLVEVLRSKLNEEYPEFNTISGYMIAINQEYATDDMVIKSSDEVAIIPPVSGG